MTFEDIRTDLKAKLKESRYIHTIGVVYTAASLAMRYECDIDKVMLASLLHDASKAEPREMYVQRAMEYNIPISEYEKESPELIHGKLSAYIANKQYGIEDHIILDAIACHTTGKPAMNIYDKILFVADYIEPSRTKQKRLSDIRKMAFTDIDMAIIMIAEDTIDYITGMNYVLDPSTEMTYLYYKKEKENG